MVAGFRREELGCPFGGLTVVTGGAGFLGSHLVELLQARGETIRVVERPGAAVDHLPNQVEVIRADIRDPEAVGQALRGADTVFHLAANPNLWARDKQEFEAVNHQGTRHVLDQARRVGAKRIIHVSTESILTRRRHHGRGRAYQMIDEATVVTESDAVGPYCLSKLRAELAAFEAHRQGAPVWIVNPTMPIGPGDRNLSPPTRLIRDFLSGRLPAWMEWTLNVIDPRDAALGMIRAAERGEPGHRHLLAGWNLTMSQLMVMLTSLSGVAAPRLRVPSGIALLFAAWEEWRADHLGGGPPQASLTGVRLARRPARFDPSLTHRILGLQPRPLENSLRDAIAWLRDAGDLASSSTE